MYIDRCICFDKTFVLLKEIARRYNVGSISALQEKVEFGKRCGLCHPYVKRMLRTGETVFTEVITGTDEPG